MTETPQVEKGLVEKLWASLDTLCGRNTISGADWSAHVAACVAIRDENASLRAKLAEAEVERKRFDVALQSLTPGGSEYVNDPERCVAVVRQIRDSHHKLIRESIKARKAAESRSSALEAEIGGLREALEKVRKWAKEYLCHAPKYDTPRAFWGQRNGRGSWNKARYITGKELLELLGKAQPLTTSLSDRMSREKAVIEALQKHGSKVTDWRNHSVHLFFGPLADAQAFANALDAITPKGETE